MKKVMAVAALALAGLMTGCGVIPTEVPMRAAIQIDTQCTATDSIDNSVKPVKKGEATAKGIILFSEGDASVKAAMDNGGIKKIHSVSYKTRNILYLFAEQTTIVWGE